MSKISIIMNCAYGVEFLREAIDSIFSQQFQDWELVFVDNCSTDGSADVVQSFEVGGRIRYTRTDARIPLYAARNIGIEKACGEYISFLDVDDLFETNMLRRLHEAMSAGADLAYGGYRFIDRIGDFTGRNVQGRARGNLTNCLLLRSFIAIGCVLVRRNVFEKNRFDPSYNILGDFELWTRLAATGSIFEPVDEYLTRIRVHGGNLSLVQLDRWITEERYFYRKFWSVYGLRYPAIPAYILKAELSHLLKRRRI